MNDPLELPMHGINQALPRVARRLYQAGFTTEETISYLNGRECELRRAYQPNEVERAVALVYSTPPAKSSARKRKEPAPVFDPDKLSQLAARFPEVDGGWVKARSPIAVESQTPESYLLTLTNEREHILCFKKMQSQGQLVWQNRGKDTPTGPLDNWRQGLENGAWILPQPVTGEWKECDRLKTDRNPKGRSRRCEECITAFRFALLESDEAKPAHWLSALVQIPLPIASIVTSGGKSIHALVLVNAPSKTAWDEIVRGQLLPFVVPLGADPAALTAVRLTRLPFIKRGTHLQDLLYLNPQPTSDPIANLPIRP